MSVCVVLRGNHPWTLWQDKKECPKCGNKDDLDDDHCDKCGYTPNRTILTIKHDYNNSQELLVM
jgi:ribosomal protein S27AE